jgi:Zn-dependent alcohol dehydrogenase
MTEVVEMLVCPQKGFDYEFKRVLMESTPQEDEILVRMVATGVCSTDFKTRDVRETPLFIDWSVFSLFERMLTSLRGHLPIGFPFVGGHEGGGVVEQYATLRQAITFS